MKKFITSILFVGLAVMLLGTSTEKVKLPTSSTTVYAKKIHKKPKWHKGTPKELRGNYEWGHNLKHPFSSSYSWAHKSINSRRIVSQSIGMPFTFGCNVRYQRLAPHRYLLKYDIPKHGTVARVKNWKEYIEKKGDKIFNPTVKKERIYLHKVNHPVIKGFS